MSAVDLAEDAFCNTDDKGGMLHILETANKKKTYWWIWVLPRKPCCCLIDFEEL